MSMPIGKQGKSFLKRQSKASCKMQLFRRERVSYMRDQQLVNSLGSVYVPYKVIPWFCPCFTSEMACTRCIHR